MSPFDPSAVERQLRAQKQRYDAPDPEAYARAHQLVAMSDYEYDALTQQLSDHYAQHGGRPDDSVLDWVGTPVDTNTFAKVVHEVPMLSLGKAMDRGQLRAWLVRMIQQHGVTHFSSDQKIDGFACELVYEGGRLTQASTRGSGTEGEDITATVTRLRTIPKVIHLNQGTVRVRGEFYMTADSFARANEVRVNVLGKEPYRNVRNGVSGCLRQKDVSSLEGTEAYFKAYGALLEDPSYTQAQGRFSDTMATLRLNTFDTVDTALQTFTDVADLEQRWDVVEDWLGMWEGLRATLDYDIDGLVFRADRYVDQARLGADHHEPRWALAYKFTAVRKETVLRDVVWTYGDKGNITPNACFDPVDLVGALTSRCTLHNIEEIEQLGLQVGDTIAVERRGDVIPKVVALVRVGDPRQAVVPPSTCPACGAPTHRVGPYVRCTQPSSCGGYLFGRLKAFLAALEVEELGPGTLEKVIAAGYVRTPADLLRLSVPQLASLERLGTKQATKIVLNLQAARQAPLHLVIAALGIPNVSVATGKLLAARYGSLPALLACEVSELVALEGIAEVMATVIHDWCQDPTHVAQVQDLVSLGLGQVVAQVPTTGKLQGRSFCFTGTLSQPRTRWEAAVVAEGGTLSSVKRGLDYLVVGTDAGSKLVKAQGYGVTILTEDELQALL